jgi:hypothetical protein
VPVIKPFSADHILVDGLDSSLTRPLDLEGEFRVKGAEVVLEANAGDHNVPFLTKSLDGRVYVLNTHTFSEVDFEAVGEVLLCPRPLGLVDLPKSWTNTIRSIFNLELGVTLEAPTRIVLQPLQNGDFVLHNYNQVEVEITMSGSDFSGIKDAFNEQQLAIDNKSIRLSMKPRSRIWLRTEY